MARIRTIKPEFWQDEKLMPLPDVTRLIFLGLVSLADDRGRWVYNPKLIEATLFDPSGPDRSRDVRESLATLSSIGRVVIGRTASGQKVLEIANWSKHQKIDKPNYSAALPEIVEVEQVTPFVETVATNSSNDSPKPSRKSRESLANDSRAISTIYDQLPTIDDQVDASSKASGKKFPHMSADHRGRVAAAWRKVGTFDMGRVIERLAPFYRPASDPQHIDHDAVTLGIEDYCGVIGAGRSSAFVSPEDCAKRLGLLAKNAITNRQDPIKRWEGAMMAIHGSIQVAA